MKYFKVCENSGYQYIQSVNDYESFEFMLQMHVGEDENSITYCEELSEDEVINSNLNVK